MDNFFSTTPVLSCARSMFMATDGLVYEPSNVTRFNITISIIPATKHYPPEGLA